MESFFGIGLPELVLILLIAGIVMGPERISVAARWLGRTTTQLQAISRGFINQLNAEIDGMQNTDEIRGTLQDMQDLRKQLDDLKQELMSVTNGAVRDGQKVFKQTEEELKRTIAPPITLEQASKSAPPVVDVLSSEELPQRIEVPDDPES
ncbi:MAG: twin-arginine translocase TatA/TatE family subunit [Candidatus Promineifilaceae bacterium]|jgi:Sec-independent protein translocase protein TatA